ncbi:MAG TPA: aldo/keto reductase [Dehalococcoidia bacterium]|jgi:aryl-alcohol dehydrogenase-like predicted oxidoreductase|nr:aldo/keto reductase [Dehalococcoidia bacterium]
MEYRHLGRSGLEVSVVGLGTNNFGGRIDMAATQAVVDQSIEEGINLFDTADVYGGQGASEEFLGKALGNRRQDVVVATKFASPMGEGPMKAGGSRHWIMNAVEDSLRRLDTDYIDLYQVHRPDANTPLDETIRALDDLVTSGKVRYLGNSNFASWQIAESHHLAKNNGWAPFISAQPQYSLLDRSIEPEIVPACNEYGLGVLPFFPLASGLLTGKYKRGSDAPEGTRLAAGPMGERMLTDRNFDKVEALETFAQGRGHTLLELAFSWLASQSHVGSVIAGATKPEQVTANAAAASWRLDEEEMAEVDQITRR